MRERERLIYIYTYVHVYMCVSLSIQVIADIAEKEFKFESALDKMRNEWRELDFDVSPYKDTGFAVF